MLGFDHISLGRDVYGEIFQWLSVADRLKLAELTHLSKETIDHPFFWQQLYRTHDLPATEEPITRVVFAQAYREKAIPLHKEVIFLLNHKNDIYGHFPRNSEKWTPLFKHLESAAQSITTYDADLKKLDDTLETINQRLIKFQSPFLPSANLTWHYLSRLKPQWLETLYQQYPQDLTVPHPIKHINFQHCGFTSLPNNISEFQQTETLDLYNTTLTSLPNTLSQLTKLRMLLCSGGNFSNFPEVICQCRGLTTLSLPEMQLTSISPDIGQLKKLKYLYLLDNHLELLPKELGQLNHLIYMPIDRNPLKPEQPNAVLAVMAKLNMVLTFSHTPNNRGHSTLDIEALTEQFQSLYLPSTQHENQLTDQPSPKSNSGQPQSRRK